MLIHDRFAHILIHFRKTFNCKISRKCCCQYTLQLVRNNFENIFKKTTIRATEVVLIQVLFLTVGSKPKNKNENTKYHNMKWKVHFSLACLGKIKVFSMTLTQAILVDVQCLHGTLNELYLFLTGIILRLQKLPSCSTLLYKNVPCTVELRHLSFSMVQQFLSHLATIRPRQFLFIWSERFFLSFKLFTA